MKQLLILVAFVLFGFQAAFAQALHDAQANSNCGGINPASPCTYSITLGSISNAVVMVGIGANSADITGAAVTVDGVSAALVSGTKQTTAGGATHTSQIWCVALGTTSGSKTVSISWSGGSPIIVSSAAMSASGGDQVTPCNNGTSEAPAFNDPLSLPVTSSATGLAMDFVVNGSTGPATPNQTNIVTDATWGYGASYATTPAATVTFTWAGSNGWQVHSGANIAAAAAGATRRGCMLLGMVGC